jgi:uncharacterized protein YfaS (alpha-2-macroglobulin family)
VQQGTSLVAVSYQQVTLKISPTEALVWVVDLRTQTPQANAPVTLFDAQGVVLGSGQTDGDGILRLPLALQAEDSTVRFMPLSANSERRILARAFHLAAGVSPGNLACL